MSSQPDTNQCNPTTSITDPTEDPLDATEALRMVERIYTRLNARRPEIDKREEYYRGEQPLSFATAEWKKANAERYTGFSDNWAGPVVNTEAERIRYRGITVPGLPKAGLELHENWLRNELDAHSSQGIISTLTTGRSFVIVWGDRITDEPIVTWEHPSNVEIEYDFENSLIRKAALKTWVDEKLEYATLYTPDWIFKYEREKTPHTSERDSQAKQSRTGIADDGGWSVREVAGEVWPLRNPMGVVPVVELQNRPTLKGDPVSEIQGVIPMQDAINLLWAYLLLAADYASMEARVILGASPPMIPILDKDGKEIGKRPVDIKDLREKRMMFISGDDAKIDSWKAAALDVFTDTIDVAVGHLSSQTRTPPTYLVSKVGMSNVNGEGLKASEGPLNEKVEEFWLFGDLAFREINRLIALARGDEALAQAVRLARVNHVPPAMRSESQIADMLVKKKTIGYPLAYLMELDGIDPSDVPRILEMKAKEDAALAKATAELAAQAPPETSNASSEVAA